MMVSSNDFAQQNALEKNPCARISYDNDNNNNNIDNINDNWKKKRLTLGIVSVPCGF